MTVEELQDICSKNPYLVLENRRRLSGGVYTTLVPDPSISPTPDAGLVAWKSIEVTDERRTGATEEVFLRLLFDPARCYISFTDRELAEMTRAELFRRVFGPHMKHHKAEFFAMGFWVGEGGDPNPKP